MDFAYFILRQSTAALLLMMGITIDTDS